MYSILSGITRSFRSAPGSKNGPPKTRNGFGGALSAGYTFMLSKHLNLEAGIGGWAGVFQQYGFYSSPEKLFVREEGRKTFIYPDQVSLSLVYVF